MRKHTPATAEVLAQRFLEPGESVLDIGAADGAYTALYADRVGPSGEVVAVEPHAASLRALRQTMKDRPWVTVWSAAVGATLGAAAFYPDRRNPKQSSLWGTNTDRPGKPYLVPVTTIDTLVEGMHHVPALIQIDAQGAEAEMLRGAVRTLRLPVTWVIEIWPAGLHRAGARIADVLQPFEMRSYQPETASGSPLSWPGAYRACEILRPDKYQHIDLVLVPAAMRVEVPA